MRRALDELTIVGVATAQPFHRLVLADRVFVEGRYDIEYFEERGRDLLNTAESREQLERIAVAVALAEHGRRTMTAPPPSLRGHPGRDLQSAWLRAARLDGMR